MIVSACEMPNNFRLLYPDDMSIKDKIETIATEIYRADGVDYAPIVNRKIRQFEEQGLAPACQSAWPKLTSALATIPSSRAPLMDFALRDYRYPRLGRRRIHLPPMCGDVRTMPGLREERRLR